MCYIRDQLKQTSIAHSVIPAEDDVFRNSIVTSRER